MLPNRDELEIFREAFKEGGVIDTHAAEAMVVTEFDAGKLTIDQVDSWLVLQRVAAPQLWQKPEHVKKAADEVSPERAAEIKELSEASFTGERHRQLTARSKLIRLVGDDECDRIAKTFGVDGFRDFASKGKTPTKANDGNNEGGDNDDGNKDNEGNKEKAAKNPWHKNFKGTAEEIEREKIRIIRVMGTRAAQGMAQAAGTTLAGAPLKVA